MFDIKYYFFVNKFIYKYISQQGLSVVPWIKTSPTYLEIDGDAWNQQFFGGLRQYMVRLSPAVFTTNESGSFTNKWDKGSSCKLNGNYYILIHSYFIIVVKF